jgi:hypothetical protein
MRVFGVLVVGFATAAITAAVLVCAPRPRTSVPASPATRPPERKEAWNLGPHATPRRATAVVVRSSMEGEASADKSSPTTEVSPASRQTPTMEDVGVSLGRAFANERVDSIWSANAKHRLEEGLGSLLIDGSSITSIDCRSTICLIKTAHRDRDNFVTFMQSALRSRLNKTWNGPFFYQLESDKEGAVAGLAYIGREDHEFAAENSP